MTIIRSLPAIQSWERQAQSLFLHCGDSQVVVTILTPSLIRVRLVRNGQDVARRSWAVTVPDEQFAPVAYDVVETPQALQVYPQSPDQQTSNFSIHIQRNPCRISFVDQDGHVFCADEAGMQWVEQPDEMAPRWSVACRKHIAAGEHFYGFGERTGQLNKRGYRLINWTTDPGTRQGPATDPLYIAIPVFMAVQPGLAYGIFLNNTWLSSFDIGYDEPDIWRMEATDGSLDYYLFFGTTPQEVNTHIAALLGAMPLPPRWALGYHQSRWSYAPEARVCEIAETFRRRNIPCDVIHLDIAYMDGYRVFTWDRERFPDLQRMIEELRRDGFRVVTIIDPGVKVDPAYDIYQQGIEQGMFICRPDGQVFQGYVWPDDSVFSDYTRKSVREWWGNLQQRLVAQGVSGIWNDMNEPPVFHQPFSQNVPKRTWGTIDLDAVQGEHDERTTHAEVHNLYGYGMAQASYEGLRNHLDGERPFVLTRSGFAGIQRWSACWMGDNNAVWEHLEMAIPQLLNMGISGVPFVGVDVGGFAGNASGELFARWMQFGTFMPFFRGHSTHFSRDHEPWAFGQQVEDVCRAAIQLRYQLLPYIYTLFWQASQQGTPVLRPMFYHFPNDTATYSLHDQFLFGPFLLVAPIYQPERTSRQVYLPSGVWYHWWNGTRVEGPCTIVAEAPLDRVPIYVRAGAIVPLAPVMCCTDEQPNDPLTMHIYPGSGSFTLYEDDGHTFAYEQGQYCTTRYELVQDEQGYLCRIGAREGAYEPSMRHIQLVVHTMDEDRAKAFPDGVYDHKFQTLTLTWMDDGQAREIVF